LKVKATNEPVAEEETNLELVNLTVLKSTQSAVIDIVTSPPDMTGISESKASSMFGKWCDRGVAPTIVEHAGSMLVGTIST
jgi:hypothetical protein